MSLFDRIGRVVRANLNDRFSKAEDPEKVLEQAVIDMQEDLTQLRQAVARVIAEQKRTEQRYNADLAEANKWQEKAYLALSKGDEISAKKAMARKESFINNSTACKVQLDELTEQVEPLQRNLTVMENRIAEAKTRKNMSQAEAKFAETSEEWQKFLSVSDTSVVRDAFERMEKKVQEMEACSQTSNPTNRTDTKRKRGFWLNDWVRNAEDPEKVLEEVVLDVQENLVQLRQAVARAIAEQKRTEQRYNADLAEANKWQDRADLVLSKGDENLAREAMARKTSFTKSAATYKAQLDQLTDLVNTLKDYLTTLECKIAEIKIKKNMLQVRAKAARANRELQNTLSRIDRSHMFEHLERKIQEIKDHSPVMIVVKNP